jgi:hypothetical protein
VGGGADLPPPAAAADEIVAAATPKPTNTRAMDSITLRRLSSEYI